MYDNTIKDWPKNITDDIARTGSAVRAVGIKLVHVTFISGCKSQQGRAFECFLIV